MAPVENSRADFMGCSCRYLEATYKFIYNILLLFLDSFGIPSCLTYDYALFYVIPAQAAAATTTIIIIIEAISFNHFLHFVLKIFHILDYRNQVLYIYIYLLFIIYFNFIYLFSCLVFL